MRSRAKAYGLAIGIVEPRELQHDWSHNTLRLSKLMVDYRAQQAALKATGLAVTGSPPVPVTADRSKAFMDKFEDPSALKEPFLGTMIDWCQLCIADHRAFRTDLARQKRHENVGQDDNGVSTAVSAAGKEKVVSVFVRFDRLLSDPRIDGNSLTVFFRRDESFKFSVAQGAEAAAGEAIPPALRSDAILLADVTRRFGQA